MKLIPYLVNIKENKKLIENNLLPKNLKSKLESKNYVFFKIDVEYLDKENYKKGTNLDKGLWTVYTHYRYNNKFYQLAFKPELEENENIEDYIVFIRTEEDEEEKSEVLRYVQEHNLFFDSDKYIHKDFNQKVSKKNIFDTAGYIDLRIKNLKTKNVQNIPIRVMPSSIDYEDYIEMIEDLISIREDIVISDGSKVGIGRQYKIKRDNFAECINNIYNHIININNKPGSKLSLENVNLPYNKIIDLKPNTIIEKSLYPYKNKYKTTISREDFNIYENQIIKYSLIQIKKKIEKFKSDLYRKFNYNDKYLDEIKSKIVELYGEDVDRKKAELKKIIQEKEDRINEIMSRFGEKERYSNDSVKLKFKLQSNLYRLPPESSIKYQINYNEHNKTFKLHFKSKYYNHYPYHDTYDFDTKREHYDYREHNDSKIRYANFTTRKINFEINVKDIRKIIFILDKLRNVNNQEIVFRVIAKRQNNRLSDILVKQDSYSKQSILVDCVDLISIDEELVPDYSLERIKEFIQSSNINLNDENEKEKLGFINCLENKTIDLQQVQKEVDTDKILNQTIDKIDKLLALNIFKNIKEKKDILRPTQLFINDFSYNKVFRELKKLNEKISFLDGISPEMYFLKSTADIYENWCLYKIVSILISDLGWRLINKEDVLKDMDALLKYEGRFDKPSVTIKLEHTINNGEILSLDLIYEGKIYYYDNEQGKERYKTPDYQFVFKSKTRGEKRVYLDAKYRNYEEQGISVAQKDINEVAIGKYYVPFENSQNAPVASFIVHSHKGEDFECFGGNHIIDNNEIQEIKTYNNDLLKKAIKDNHRFGAFVMLPSYSFNLNKFLRMILEYHFGMYDICWNCGEVEDIKKEQKRTQAGNIKYHYTCNKCNDFWVKNHCREDIHHPLIKHVDNYHSINKDKNDPWYVICPVCFNGMSGK